jgi:hypothetical protein
VALVVFGNRLDGFGQWLGHERPPLSVRRNADGVVAVPQTGRSRSVGLTRLTSLVRIQSDLEIPGSSLRDARNDELN